MVVSLRGDSDMFDLQARNMTSDVWTTIKSGTGKTITVQLNPTTPGQPKVLVRVQLLRKKRALRSTFRTRLTSGFALVGRVFEF